MRSSVTMEAAAGARAFRKGFVLAVVAATQFMIVLDVAIVNVAIPNIQQDLAISQDFLLWVLIANALPFGGFLLLGGRAGDLFGHRRMLLAGLALFSVSSLVAGLSGSLAVLVGARAGQGFGGALIVPASLSILQHTFPEGLERNRALAIFGGVAGSAASVGFIAGGALTNGPGWEWVFFINVPIGLLLILGAASFVAESSARDGRGLDVSGAVIGTGGLLALVLALNRSVAWGWDALSTIGLLVLAAALLGLFVLVQMRSRAPMMPLRIFRKPAFGAANAIAFLLFGGLFTTLFLSTLYMQQVLGFSSLRAGLSYLGFSLAALAGALVAGSKLMHRVGVRPPLIAGPVMAAAGLAWLSRVPVDGGYPVDLLPGFLLVGFGFGLGQITAQITAFSGVAEPESGLASGLITTSQEIGGALGIAISGTVAFAATQPLLARGDDPASAFTAGFQDGYLAGAVIVATAAAIGWFARATPASAPEPSDQSQAVDG